MLVESQSRAKNISVLSRPKKPSQAASSGERYLLGMKMFFDIEVLSASRRVLEIVVKDGKLAGSREVSYSGSLFV